ncbi:MAG: Asp-tRNA(Asn)/Glu-tRNA(Gln) amidotransferase subunit GatB [Oscillospiraceae bacterium]|nr:Asp-tRNA(Asn)/Glu-tRNA(Gln) amidotransferase subunit GatB [Oscillospiraceae bacterium]
MDIYNSKYDIVIGLEVHAELCTKTKGFCDCKNEFGGEVNTNCCPGCIGLPGTLPTLNEEVVNFALKAGHALNCEVNLYSKYDRKNYFYPDLAKGYQTTQFDVPICHNGYVDLLEESGETKRIRVARVHIEEDTAKLIHEESFDGTLIDFNRSGVPLIEIVSEPDLRSGRDAKLYLETLRLILVAIGVSDGKMQEGSIRCDVNVSVMPKGCEVFGTRVEMKNVNTFTGAVRAIEYEAERQIALLESGGKIFQETRRWDDAEGKNFLMRSKEDANDYRYFPEPDLLTLSLSKAHVDALKESLPELPNARILRLMKDYGLKFFDAQLLMENLEKCAFFEECAALDKCKPQNLSNWILGDISRLLNAENLTLSDTKLTSKSLCEMVGMIESGAISSAAGKTIIEIILYEEKSPGDIVKEKGLSQISDLSALESIAKAVVEANAGPVEQYNSGKTNVLGFLVGQCMKQSKGQGNPAVLKEILLKLIKK